MICVASLGNILCGDDGIGPEILKELNEINFAVTVEMCDVGSNAFNLLDRLISSDVLIIIDCAQMGRSPGEVIKFNIDSVGLPVMEKLVSLHGFGFGEILAIARSLGRIAKCIVIGIEPKSIMFDSSLSQEVKNSIPQVIQMVSEEITDYAEKNFNH